MRESAIGAKVYVGNVATLLDVMHRFKRLEEMGLALIEMVCNQGDLQGDASEIVKRLKVLHKSCKSKRIERVLGLLE